MYDSESVIKRDVYPQKFIQVLKISVVYHFVLCSKNIRGISKNIYHRCNCMDIPVVERLNALRDTLNLLFTDSMLLSRVIFTYFECPLCLTVAVGYTCKILSLARET